MKGSLLVYHSWGKPNAQSFSSVRNGGASTPELRLGTPRGEFVRGGMTGMLLLDTFLLGVNGGHISVSVGR